MERPDSSRSPLNCEPAQTSAAALPWRTRVLVHCPFSWLRGAVLFSSGGSNMYSVVLMMALTGGAEVPQSHNGGGCWGSSYGCNGGYSCNGGGCHGGGLFRGHGGHGCNGGCSGYATVSYGCNGCSGGYGCNGGGCNGGHRLLGGGLFNRHRGGCSGTVSSCCAPVSSCCAPVAAPCCGGVITAPAVMPATPGAVPASPMPKPATPAAGTIKGSVEPMPTVEGANVFVADSVPQRRILGGGLFGRRNR